MFLYVSKQTFRKLYGYITRELLGLRIRNFQGISLHEHKHIGRLSNLHWCTFKSTKSQKYYKNLTDINPLSAKLTTWPNTLKQFVGNLPTNCLSVFDHFLGLALKGLKLESQIWKYLHYGIIITAENEICMCRNQIMVDSKLSFSWNMLLYLIWFMG